MYTASLLASLGCKAPDAKVVIRKDIFTYPTRVYNIW
jgi:hypothetical protein